METQQLTFGDYLTLGISAVVLLVWLVLRVQRALNPNLGRQGRCAKTTEVHVGLDQIGRPALAKDKRGDAEGDKK
ncbi:MAG: hypothetical protein H7842_13850 [Gammaproteobacteria bacterium SHHR-1]|uniref:hypothetical protein n=1 Tax=Magnetovirga frankeli TaxID=947516 RepID=UPI001292D438|nr:hypothetical protein D5125_04120 [gamma proteobacterium SS-5]